MLVIGLTGGIGSGKTTVADMFAEQGISIIDADQIARELTVKGHSNLEKIIAYFGSEILNTDQQLNRIKLRDIIFADIEKRLWLEQLLHPQILQTIQERLATLPSLYCLIVIPLLIETQKPLYINRILVVDTEEDKRIQRILTRDNISRETLQKIIQIQVTRTERLAAADDIIHNNHDLSSLHRQVRKLHYYYLELAAKVAHE